MSRILVINSGSSSLKYQLIDVATERVLAAGLIDRIGEGAGLSPAAPPETADAEAGGLGRDALVWRASTGGASRPSSAADPTVSPADHTQAFKLMLHQLDADGIDPRASVDAIGHRVVHGGERFVEPTIITGEVKRQIDELSTLAPLHNPPNLAGIVAAEKTFPGVPQVAVFDTAFHRTLPPVARTYAIDAALAASHGIRRFGFHGISNEHVSKEAARVLGRPLAELKLIVLHLGNGASATAVDGGRSVETSMGLTPLEGLMMGTRGGDLDPGVLIHLQRVAGFTADELDELLNHRSGLLGVAGHRDMRDVQAAAASGDAQARLALDLFEHRVRGYVGAYLAQLGGADAIVFTAGVGENNASIRAGALAGLDAFGILLDATLNESPSKDAREVSAAGSRTRVLVIPTNEELEIARQTAALVP